MPDDPVLDDIEQALLQRLAFAVARMHDQVLGSDGNGTFDLAAQGGDGL